MNPVLFILLLGLGLINTTTPSSVQLHIAYSSISPQPCTLTSNLTLTLTCSGLIATSSVTNSTPEPEPEPPWRKWTRPRLSLSQMSSVHSIQITSSNMAHLSLSIFSPFSSLTTLEVTGSKVKFVVGPLPPFVSHLNLSANNLYSIAPDAFTANAALESLDLAHNFLSNISYELLKTSPALRLLSLRGNKFSCMWVRNELYKWWAGHPNPDNALAYENATLCTASEIAFEPIPFIIALRVKKVALEECGRTVCACDVRGHHFGDKVPGPDFPLAVVSAGMNATVSLKLDCGHLGLTELPAITPFATVLNVEGNRISRLDRIVDDKNYANLIGLIASGNDIESIEFLTRDARFIEKFQFILLDGNQIGQIPTHVIHEIFKQTRMSLMLIKLGHNSIECDCFTITRLKDLLISNEKVIDDWKNITCKSPVKSLLDLKAADVCSDSDSASAEHMDIILTTLIVVESVLIVAIVGKVWWDSRRYRETGNLPRCSLWIPRLPCDFMLEGLKESSKETGRGQRSGGGKRSSCASAQSQCQGQKLLVSVP